MKTILYSLMAMTLSIQPVCADWLDLKEVSVDYARYTYAVNPYLAPYYTPTNKLDLNVKMDLIENWTFVNLRVHSETDKDQYRLVGLNYALGVHLGKIADVYFEHFSQHLLDYVPPSANTYDSVGIKFFIYRSEK